MVIENDGYAFISYSSSNRQEAKTLYEALTNKPHQLTCWLDVMEIDSHSLTFQEQIVSAIRNASCLVMVETDEAKESDYVDLEIKVAEQYNLPVFRYQVKKKQPEFVQKLRIFYLAQRIKFRTAQPFWVSLTLLTVLLAVMAGVIFLFGRSISPWVAQAADRVLPQAAQIPVEVVPLEELISPETAAPFHYTPTSFLLQDDFREGESLELSQNYYYDIYPPNKNVHVGIQNGSLTFDIPSECQQQNPYPCEVEIHSQDLTLNSIEYFGFRARISAIYPGQNLSFSISVPSWTRRRTGFGWNLSEHVTPFYRSFTQLPEEDFYAYVTIDRNWHAYEILVDHENAALNYYVDGQLIDKHTMKYFTEWQSAPLCLIIYALGNGEENQTAPVDTHIEVDQILIGGFE